MKKFFNEWAIPLALGVAVIGSCCAKSYMGIEEPKKETGHKSIFKDEPIFIAPF